MCLKILYLIYMYKEDLDNLQWLICLKTKSNQTSPSASHTLLTVVKTAHPKQKLLSIFPSDCQSQTRFAFFLSLIKFCSINSKKVSASFWFSQLSFTKGILSLWISLLHTSSSSSSSRFTVSTDSLDSLAICPH